MNRKMKVILGLAVLAVVILVMAAGMISKGKEQSSPHQESSSRPTSQTGAPGIKGEDPNLASTIPETESDRIKAVVEEFLLAYGGQSWEDPTPISWISRTQQFTTENYANRLNQLFGKADAGPAWSEFVDHKTVRQPIIDELRIVQSQGFSKGVVTLIVSYRIATSSDGGTPDSFESFNRMVHLVNVNKAWLVDDFGNVAAGYAPDPEGVATAPAVPPQVGD